MRQLSTKASSKYKIGPGSLAPAFEVAGRFCARMARQNPGSSVIKIGTSQGLTFEKGGSRVPLGLFEIVRFAERMKAKNWIDRFDIAGSDVVVYFNEIGKNALFEFSNRTKAQDAPADERVLMHERILATAEERQRRVTATLATEQRLSINLPEARIYPKSESLIAPILLTLMSDARAIDEVVKLVAVGMEVELHKRNEPWLENGMTFDAAVRHAVAYLLKRGLVTQLFHMVELTLEGRDRASAIEHFDVVEYKKPDASFSATLHNAKGSVGPRLLSERELHQFCRSLSQKSHRDLLGIWRNAVRIVSDDARVKYHDQARIIIRVIENGWESRVKSGAVADVFKWTEVTEAEARTSPNVKNWVSELMVGEGMLKEMGYTVGRNGLPASVRQAMLSQIFARTLPPVFPEPYMRQWGESGSARRLQKIADCLATFARNAARLPGNYEEAISDWREDLEYLYYNHYEESFGFGWPKYQDVVAPISRPHVF